MRITMTRSVKDKKRYYTLELILNLFGEWLLIRTYGSVKAKRPTRVIQEIYAQEVEATDSMHKLLEKKEKKGYRVICL